MIENILFSASKHFDSQEDIQSSNIKINIYSFLMDGRDFQNMIIVYVVKYQISNFIETLLSGDWLYNAY